MMQVVVLHLRIGRYVDATLGPDRSDFHDEDLLRVGRRILCS